MTDDFYKQQLESFGIEATRVKPEKSIRREQKEKSQENTLKIIKLLMGSPEGRWWLYEQLDKCQTFTPAFVPGKQDVSDFFSGLQAFGLQLFSDVMTASPENFHLMNQEAAHRALGNEVKQED